jgi:hypothetical protein
MEKMTKVDFVVVGFPKCGTTSLCNLLASHKDIFLPREKETCFFSGNFSHNFEWLQRKYIKEARLYGEACNHYIYKEEALSRILLHNPDMKFIVCIRDPEERFISDIKMRLRWGDQSIAKRREILCKSNLAKYLKNLLCLVPKDNVFVVNVFDQSFEAKPLLDWLGISKAHDNLQIHHEGMAFRSRSNWLNFAKADRLIAQFLLNSKFFYWIFPVARLIRRRLFPIFFTKDDTTIVLTQYEQEKLLEYKLSLLETFDK